jgi:hypothetical protein
LLIRLSGVFLLPRCKKIYLSTAGIERASVLATDAEQDYLGDVSKVESDPTSVGAAVLPNLVPYEIGLVGKAPSLKNM